ncbi:MAG: hypothetical protein ACRD1K_14620 [Acidimicrobiales bacterium]
MGTDEGWQPLRRARPPLEVHLPASPFSRLAVAHALAVVGDSLVTMALAGSLFFSISPTEARGRVALSLVLTIAPFAVVAPLVGSILDRVRGGRRLIVLGAAAGRAAAAVVAARVIDGLLLFPVAFVLLVLSKTHAVAKSSLVPTVVESKEDLVGANSRLALLSAVVGLLAAIPGVAVLKLLGSDWVMRLAAASFVATAVASLRVVQIRPDDPGLRAAASAELRDAGIRLAGTAMGVLRGSVGFLTFLLAFGLRRDDAPAWVFGAVLVASIAGTVLGTVVAPRVRKRVVEEHLLAGCLALVAAGALAAAFYGGRVGAALAAGVLGVAASGGRLAFDSLVQRDAPDAAQGRWFARFEAVFQLAWVTGALLPVALTVAFTPGCLALAAGGGGALFVYLSGLRAAHHRG